MARGRKRKLKEPEKLWEVPLEELERRIELISRSFPTSGYLKSLKAEVARTERSGPMNYDNED